MGDNIKVLDAAVDEVTLLARRAAVRANDAANHALAAHQSVGVLTREVSELRSEVRAGFHRLEGKMRKAQESLSDAEDDITVVRDLRKAARRWRNRAVGATMAVIVAVLTAGIAHYLHWGP